MNHQSRLPRILVATIVSLTLAGCASFHYQGTKTGTLDGVLRVEWVGENRFVYVPDEKHPLTFISSDGRVIVPQRMYTDGGSIPPIFWGFPGLSPWGYAPGYIIHDWLFEMRRCKYPGYDAFSFADSARILSEAIKTLMVLKKVEPNPEAMYAIYEGVSSPIAQKLWEEGECKPATVAKPDAPRPLWALPGQPASKPIVVFELDFRAK